MAHSTTMGAAAARQVDVVILGGGMSALAAAIELKRVGWHDFVMLEKQSGLGGTWWDNRYPGAHVDVPAPLYSFSFAPHAHWKRRFAAASEIQAYMQGLAERYGVLPHLRLGMRVLEARFDVAQGRWHIRCENGECFDAAFFICSTGLLSQVRWPQIPGLEDFAGTKLHSARWDSSVPLAGQRVAVIGTGSTASQLVPPIAEQAAQLQVYQRTANWVLPRFDRLYNGLDRALMRVPGYGWLTHRIWYHLAEWGRRAFDEGSSARRRMVGFAKRHLRRQVADEALRAKLKPTYPYGCKRIIYSSDFYPALMRPNVELVTEGIERITATGIRTTDGRERPIDVLVCATGFDTTHLLASLDVFGAQGQRLADSWGGNPEAYRGVTLAGFPNLFLLLGPNTGTGHTSTLLYIEPQVRFAVAAMQRVRAQGKRCITVREEVSRQWNEALQARLQGSVWGQCRSWYRADNGRIVALWPGFTREYVRGLDTPEWGDYRID